MDSESMTHVYRDGGSIAGPSAVVSQAAERDRSEISKEQEWVRGLIAAGVKAAHPDDGWVDRAAETVTFAYPFFGHSPAEGDLIALGWHGRHRLVRVTSVRRWGVLTPMTTYSFVQEP